MPLLLLALAALLCGPLSAAPVADLVIFDEDDPLGRDYYDASIGKAHDGSSLRLTATSRDKMPVTTNSAVSGRFSGVLEWTARPGGNWEMHVFRPGFGLFNLGAFHTISVALNGPKQISADALPVIEIQDVRGRKLSSPLKEFLESGIDADTGTWQRILVPIAALRDDAQFNSGAVKHISFRQAVADGVSHVLWIDDLRLQARERLVVTQPPSAPTNLNGRPGDRSLTLRWDAVADQQVRRYRVYQSESEGGPFVELPASPVTSQSIADVHVTNGKKYFYHVNAENEAGLGPASPPLRITPRAFTSDDDFLEYLQATAFDYFWTEANPKNGMLRDRTQPWSAASIAAMGFGLTAMGIGIDHRWITREQGSARALRTLQTLWSTPQGAADSGTSGHKGWFYHFLNFEDGTRFGTSELSSIDTALLLAGVLYAQEYFTANNAAERQIRSLAQRIFDRVDWAWMLNGEGTLTMGWYPERGFTKAHWNGYNEASILYIMGLGSSGPTRLKPEHWKNWTSTYDWRTSEGQTFIHFPPLFGHQYSACWIDFRNVADDYTAAKGITYFENSRRATIAQRAYCIRNPGQFPGYGTNIWGLTACDGPGSNGTYSYSARGAPPAENDDGTIAPTGPGGSLPFAPEECVRALRAMYDQYREKIWCGYGFRDAFNLKENWWGEDVIGIDQGPILIMAENMRNGRVWLVMRRNAALQQGLKQAGFRPFPDGTRFQR